MITKHDKYLRDYELHCQHIAQSTSINISENTEEKAARIKKLESVYVDWFEYYFPEYATSSCAWYHTELAWLIIENPVLYLIFEAYRGAAKSVHVTMGIPLWLMFTGQMNFFLLIGENEDKAKILLSDSQAQLQYNQRIINDYGKQHSHGSWADGDFTTSGGKKFMSLGLGQSPRGVRNAAQRPDYIVCDDLDAKKRCNNDRLIRESVEWIMEDLWGCFDAGRERFVLANNRIHKNSILANLVKEFDIARTEYKNEGLKPEHFHIKVNAVKNESTFEPEWPEKYTADYWRNKFRSRPKRSAQREYMNNPIEDGLIFLYEYMQWKEMLPLSDYDGLVMYGDLSYKDKGDYKALELWGKKMTELHCIHVFLRQVSRAVCAQWLYNLYEAKELKNFSIRYLIEGLFAQDEFVSDFDIEGTKRGYHIPVSADTGTKGNKFDRIESIVGYWERGDTYYNIKEKKKKDQITLIDQHLGFEKGSNMNDDGPDAAHGAISELNKITHVDKFTPRILKYLGLQKYRY